MKAWFIRVLRAMFGGVPEPVTPPAPRTTTAQRIQALGIGAVVLPDCGEQVEYHAIKTEDAELMGCLPLVVNPVNVDDLPPEEQSARVKDILKTAKKVCCECADAPKFVGGKPRTGRVECSIEALTDDDVLVLYFDIIELSGLRRDKAQQDTPAVERCHSMVCYVAWFWHMTIEEVRVLENDVFTEYLDGIGHVMKIRKDAKLG